jgi:hypothetical protein
MSRCAPVVPDEELAQRLEKVRRVKLSLGRDLTDAELDAILPPIDCRRTRQRLAGLPLDGGRQKKKPRTTMAPGLGGNA